MIVVAIEPGRCTTASALPDLDPRRDPPTNQSHARLTLMTLLSNGRV